VKRKLVIGFIVGALAVCGCAHVQQEYAVYEGAQKTFKGEGGTKTVTNGIDFWTSGSPPRSYRVLGVLTDQRRDQRFSAASFGSDVAIEVKKVGGDAVVILEQAKEFVGTYSANTISASTHGSANSMNNTTYLQSNTTALGSGTSIAIRDKIVRLLVIKYVED
jgi:hypothetical protein